MAMRNIGRTAEGMVRSWLSAIPLWVVSNDKTMRGEADVHETKVSCYCG
jgi:hypothetical protein